MAVGMRHQLIGALGGGVELQWVVNSRMLGIRQSRVGPINAAAAGVRKVRRSRMSTRFQNVCESDNVAIDVGPWVREGVAHAGLGSQVDYPVEAVLPEAVIYRLHVSEVRANKPVGASCGLGSLGENSEPCLLEGRIVVVVDHIETDHLVPSLQ